MKVQFEMTDDELNEIKEISQRPSIPVMKIGSYTSGSEKQTDVNEVWKRLANKYGFVWDSAERFGNNPKIFLARKNGV